MRRTRAIWSVVAVVVVVAALGAWGNRRPMPKGPEVKLSFPSRTSVDAVLPELERRGVVRSAWLTLLEFRLARLPRVVPPGEYAVRPGMTAHELSQALAKPLPRMVTIPEGLWAARTAELLDEAGLDGRGYLEAAQDVEAASQAVGLRIPARSLEGYLFPDTYDWPPGTPPDRIVRQQLQAFADKVLPELPPGADVHRIVTVASMVELEAKVAAERARIAGVVYNRLKHGMRLEIDATVLYGIQEWRELRPGEVRRLDSPYNTYLRDGLPPGPVCSPGLASIRAAVAPEQHGYLFYVALPDGSHLFSRDYAGHLKNIRKARAAR